MAKNTNITAGDAVVLSDGQELRVLKVKENTIIGNTLLPLPKAGITVTVGKSSVVFIQKHMF